MTERSTQTIASEAAAEAAQSGKLLKRADAARILGMSVSSLRRREGTMLTPIIDDDGVHLFDEAEVEAVRLTLRRTTGVADDETRAGETAANVFTLLDEGVHPVDVVKQLRLPPTAVLALHTQWADMRQSFIVTRAQAVELSSATRTTPATTFSSLSNEMRKRQATLTRMRQGSSRCHVCRELTASICASCVVETRGSFGYRDYRVERRDVDGSDEFRLALDVFSAGLDDRGVETLTVFSDWTAVGEISPGFLFDLVEEWRKYG